MSCEWKNKIFACNALILGVSLEHFPVMHFIFPILPPFVAWMQRLRGLLFVAFAVKVATYICISAVGSFFRPLDASCTLISLRFGFLRPFLAWDGMHFVSIGLKGYLHEHNCAFFPLLPFLLASPTADLVIVKGLVVNLVAHLASVWMLWQITLVKAPDIAFQSVMFFILNAASAFHSGIYTESIFTALFLSGVYWLLIRKSRWNSVKGMLCWLAAGFTRSNAMLSAILLALDNFFLPFSWNLKIKNCLFASLCAVPFVLVQFYFWKKMEFPHFLSYSYIQSKYW